LVNLIKKSNHPEQLFDFVKNFSHKRTKDFDTDPSTKFSSDSLSLNENHSTTLTTPFHLSFFDKKQISSKKKGQFFTPSYISNFISEKSLSYYLDLNKIVKLEDTLLNFRIADIATGTGNLLMSLLYAIYKRLHPITDKKKKSLHSFLSNNVYSFDLDPFALFIQKIRLLLFSSLFLPEFDLPNLKDNMKVGNTLIDDQTLNGLSSTSAFKPIKILNQEQSPKFDIVVSNPPYMSYGLRDAQKYHPEFKHFLRNRYKSAEYKLSLYPIFIERSLELLAENGILGIITPDSHLLGRYYSKLRSYILDQSKILDLSLLGFEPFKGVTLGKPTISFFKKNSSNTNENTQDSFPLRLIPSLTSFLKEDWNDFPNFQSSFKENEYKRFYLYFNIQDKKYVEQWREKAKSKLNEVITMHTGIRARIGQRNIVGKTKKGDSWKKGIISSSQVLPFHVDYKTDWLNITPSILWSGGFNEQVVERPKIILRQTGYKIIAAVDTEGYYHLNNCHSVAPISPECNLYALATQLNSVEFDKVYSILSMEKGRALAQVDMDFLLNRFVISTTEKQDTILEEFYWKENKKRKQKTTAADYSLFNLLD